MWYGFDPGGTFGLAKLDDDGNYTCAIAKSFDDALDYVSADCDGIGIDSVLWWSHRQGGGRRADDVVRQACISGGGKGGTVSPINSLQGAMFIPAYLLIRAIRIKLGPVNVTEAHPKALLHALQLPVWRPDKGDGDISLTWNDICVRWKLNGLAPKTEHERDAIVAAVAAREGFSGRWTRNFAKERSKEEFALDEALLGEVQYFWP